MLYTDPRGTKCNPPVFLWIVGTRTVSTPNGKPFTRWVAIGGSLLSQWSPTGPDNYLKCDWDEQRVQDYKVKEYVTWEAFIYCYDCHHDYGQLVEITTLVGTVGREQVQVIGYNTTIIHYPEPNDPELGHSWTRICQDAGR